MESVNQNKPKHFSPVRSPRSFMNLLREKGSRFIPDSDRRFEETKKKLKSNSEKAQNQVEGSIINDAHIPVIRNQELAEYTNYEMDSEINQMSDSDRNLALLQNIDFIQKSEPVSILRSANKDASKESSGKTREYIGPFASIAYGFIRCLIYSNIREFNFILSR